MVLDADLPLPMTWSVMPFRVDLYADKNSMYCHYVVDDLDKGSENSSESVKSKISRRVYPDDVLSVKGAKRGEIDFEVGVSSVQDFDPSLTITRTIPKAKKDIKDTKVSKVPDVTNSDSHNSAIDVVGNIQMITAWNHSNQFDTKVFRKDKSSRKQPYVDLLVAKDVALRGHASGESGMHEGGFATLHKLMAGEAVNCPLCLEVILLISVYGSCV